ncbi:MAG: hypothetical protein M1822_003990 [Bathelium mastoideum]|nr:MAG: hypothetical protein M1822_003990 [Bathelium mastoideum]
MDQSSQDHGIESEDAKAMGKEVEAIAISSDSNSLEAPEFAPSRYDAFMKTYDGVSLLVNLQSTPTALVTSLGPALLTGGPRVLFWGPIAGWVVATCVAGSLAEMASIEPYAGGQYIWTYTNAPTWLSARTRLMLSHIQAYITWFAWMLSAALIPTIMTSSIMELVEIYHPNVTNWTQQHIGGIEVLIGSAIIFLAFLSILNKWLRIVLRPLEMLGFFLTVLIVIILLVVFPVKGERNSAHEAFFSGTLDGAGTAWGNSGLAFCQGVSLLYVMYSGVDGIIHVAAEVTNPEVKVPKTIFNTTQVGALLVLPLAVVVPLFMGPLTQEVLSSPYPITQILFNLTDNTPLVACVTCFITLQIFPAYCGILLTASRLTLQFAQQGGMPEWWCRTLRLRSAYGPLIFSYPTDWLSPLASFPESVSVTQFGVESGPWADGDS